jgi:hypothetical protein
VDDEIKVEYIRTKGVLDLEKYRWIMRDPVSYLHQWIEPPQARTNRTRWVLMAFAALAVYELWAGFYPLLRNCYVPIAWPRPFIWPYSCANLGPLFYWSLAVVFIITPPASIVMALYTFSKARPPDALNKVAFASPYTFEEGDFDPQAFTCPRCFGTKGTHHEAYDTVRTVTHHGTETMQNPTGEWTSQEWTHHEGRFEICQYCGGSGTFQFTREISTALKGYLSDFDSRLTEINESVGRLNQLIEKKNDSITEWVGVPLRHWSIRVAVGTLVVLPIALYFALR